MNDFDWITGDQHFAHKNILRFCYRPHWREPYDHRHDEMLIENWNTMVSPSDTILHTGDFANRCSKDHIRFIAEQLNGTVTLIKGNHDRQTTGFYESLGFTVIEPLEVRRGSITIHISHYPMQQLGDKHINLHGHLHNNYADCLTYRHRNVGVDLSWGYPLPYKQIIEEMIAKVKSATR